MYSVTCVEDLQDLNPYVIVGAGGGAGKSGEGSSISGFANSVVYTAPGGTLTKGGSGGGKGASCPHQCGGSCTRGTNGASDGASSYTSGQGTTTREFGEAAGKLYAGGGGGSSVKKKGCGTYTSDGFCRDEYECSTSGGAGGTASGNTANTGGGANGGGKGGSGIVIIRNS